jgi:hypothetical protein
MAESCDPADAQRLLDADCATLRGTFVDGKADLSSAFARTACRMGFYAACPVPDQCDAEPEVVVPEDGACAEYASYRFCGACEYYRCREAHANCGPDAYLINYAGRYCDRFVRVTEPRVGPEAAAWLERVRACLISELEAVPYDADCETIGTAGLHSHSVCYIETGFCALAVSDWWGIIHSIDPGDAPFRVMMTTAQGCVREWMGLDD